MRAASRRSLSLSLPLSHGSPCRASRLLVRRKRAARRPEAVEGAPSANLWPVAALTAGQIFGRWRPDARFFDRRPRRQNRRILFRFVLNRGESESEEDEAADARKLVPSRLVRERKPPVRFAGTFKGSHIVKTALGARRGHIMAVAPCHKIAIPLSLKQAEASPHADGWREARMVELGRIEELGTWELVDPPQV